MTNSLANRFDNDFIGDDLQDLFITSAQCIDKPELEEQYPQGGDIFRVRIEGIKGVERFQFGA